MERHSVVDVVVEVVVDKPVVIVLVAGRLWSLQRRLGHMKSVASPCNPYI